MQVLGGNPFSRFVGPRQRALEDLLKAAGAVVECVCCCVACERAVTTDVITPLVVLRTGCSNAVNRL